MAVALPDIIGEYIDAPERYVTDGIQFTGYFETPRIAPEQVSNLFLFMQNTLSTPVVATVRAIVPESGGFLRKGQSLLAVRKAQLRIELGPAEAGLLTLPVTTTEHVTEGEHTLTIELEGTAKGSPTRVRSPSSRSALNSALIDSLVGLNLVGTVGSTYEEKPVKNVEFTLQVAGDPAPPERAPKLDHEYIILWQQDQLEMFNHAIHEINLREVQFQKELLPETLYTMFYAESTLRFGDVGLPLRVGEAITLAKILTYTSQYFLSSAERRNGLLVPIWEQALEAEFDTTDALEVIRTVGYYHLLKLAIAISFGIVAKAVGRQPWPLLERQAVANFVAESVLAGQELDVDFLYLPLLMAGTKIFDKIEMDGEDVHHSLALMRQAYEARTHLFDAPELAQANKIYQHILKKSQAR